MALRAKWKYQPKKWVGDSLNGYSAPDGPMVDVTGEIQGYVVVEGVAQAVVVADKQIFTVDLDDIYKAEFT